MPSRNIFILSLYKAVAPAVAAYSALCCGDLVWVMSRMVLKRASLNAAEVLLVVQAVLVQSLLDLVDHIEVLHFADVSALVIGGKGLAHVLWIVHEVDDKDFILPGAVRFRRAKVCTISTWLAIFLSTYMATSLGWSKPVWNLSATNITRYSGRSKAKRKSCPWTSEFMLCSVNSSFSSTINTSSLNSLSSWCITCLPVILPEKATSE